MAFDGDLPDVAIHDLVIHPRENELVLGTHGRSIFIGDVSLLQQLTPELQAKELHLFSLNETTRSSRWGNNNWNRWRGFNEPEMTLSFYSKSVGKVNVKVLSEKGITLQQMELEADKGLNFATYDFTFNEDVKDDYLAELKESAKEGDEEIELEASDNEKWYLQAGKYTVEISSGSTTVSEELNIKAPKGKKPRAPNKKTP